MNSDFSDNYLLIKLIHVSEFSQGVPYVSLQLSSNFLLSALEISWNFIENLIFMECYLKSSIILLINFFRSFSPVYPKPLWSFPEISSAHSLNLLLNFLRILNILQNFSKSSPKCLKNRGILFLQSIKHFYEIYF